MLATAHMKKLQLIGLMLVASVLGGCASTVIGAAAGGALVVAQDRSVGDAVDDFTIQTQINERLFAEDAALFTKVNLTVTEGNVVMTGAVPTPDDKVTAARLAWQVESVQSVVNELQVDETSSIRDAARDTWISTQLRAKMLTDTNIWDINYTLDTVNSVIYVMGIARNQAELDKVLTYAREIKHVDRVVNLVRVNGAS